MRWLATKLGVPCALPVTGIILSVAHALVLKKVIAKFIQFSQDCGGEEVSVTLHFVAITGSLQLLFNEWFSAHFGGRGGGGGDNLGSPKITAFIFFALPKCFLSPVDVQTVSCIIHPPLKHTSTSTSTFNTSLCRHVHALNRLCFTFGRSGRCLKWLAQKPVSKPRRGLNAKIARLRLTIEKTISRIL